MREEKDIPRSQPGTINVVGKSVLPTFHCVTDTFGHMSIKNLARHFVEIKMLTFKFMKTQKDHNSWLSTKEEPN